MPDHADAIHPQASAALPDGSAFACTLRSHGRDAAWIRVTGELDLAAALQLSRALSDAAAFASRIVLDLRELSFMDSSGLHLIVAATRRQREAGGRLVLVRGPHQIDRIFSLTGLTEVVEFIDLDASAPALDCPA